jgi:xanthine dehydrogenase accessory factor
VLNATIDGRFISLKNIGDTLTQGEIVALVADKAIKAKISGIIRGLLRSNIEVKEGVKAGEIDPVNQPRFVVGLEIR